MTETEARLPEDLLSETGVVVTLGDGPGDEALARGISDAAGLNVRLVGAHRQPIVGENGQPDGLLALTPDHRARWLIALANQINRSHDVLPNGHGNKTPAFKRAKDPSQTTPSPVATEIRPSADRAMSKSQPLSISRAILQEVQII